MMTKEELYQAYVIERKSTRQIAVLLGFSQPWARKILRDNGIPIRDKLDRSPAIPLGTKFTEEHKRRIGKSNQQTYSKKKYKSRPWRKTGKQVRCTYCGRLLWRKRVHLSYEKHFCDQKCFGKWRAKNLIGEAHPRFSLVKVNCAWCGAEIQRHPSAIKRSKYFFCSKKHNGQWKSANLVGAKIYNFKGGYDYYGENWRMQRRRALERDNYACKRCGKPKEETKRNPDVHHIKSFRVFGLKNYRQANELSNLISYCKRCHKIVEQEN